MKKKKKKKEPKSKAHIKSAKENKTLLEITLL